MQACGCGVLCPVVPTIRQYGPAQLHAPRPGCAGWRLTSVPDTQVVQHDSLNGCQVLWQHLVAPAQGHQLSEAAQAGNLQRSNVGGVPAEDKAGRGVQQDGHSAGQWMGKRKNAQAVHGISEITQHIMRLERVVGMCSLLPDIDNSLVE